MKKLFFLLACCFLMMGSFAQTNGCTPLSSLNFSTGQDGNGGTIAMNVTDPLWGGTSIPNMTGIFAPWNNIPGAVILTSGLSIGTKTFKRCFYLCRDTIISFSGVFRDDNQVNSFVLKNSSSSTVWTFNTAPYTPSINPQCWKDIPFSGSVTLPAGQYCFEFTYTNQGGLGGFALKGTISASSAILSNFPNCCCDCSLLPNQFSISGPTCFCLSNNCNTVLTYNAPHLNPNCFKYSWKVSPSVPFTGQGTEHVTINCKDLKPGTYTITCTISCGGKAVTSTITLTVCAKPSPAFSMVSNGSSVTLNATGASHCKDYWFLVTDKDNNCAYTSGETVQFLAGNPVTFTGLVNNQQYTVYHFVICQCGNCICWSYQIMCFKWLPAQLMKTARGAKGVESISDKESDNLNGIPAEFKKELPKELFIERRADEREMQRDGD